MRILLELTRIILLLILVGGLTGIVLNQLYTLYRPAEDFQWLGGMAILCFFFIWYRNKLQFSGWYRGKSKHKLPNRAALTLISCASFLLVAPFILGYFI